MYKNRNLFYFGLHVVLVSHHTTCVCMHVCLYVCMYIGMHVCMCIMFAYMYIYVHMYYVCTYELRTYVSMNILWMYVSV